MRVNLKINNVMSFCDDKFDNPHLALHVHPSIGDPSFILTLRSEVYWKSKHASRYLRKFLSNQIQTLYGCSM